MNQDNNYNVAPVGDNTGIPEMPGTPDASMTPVQDSVVQTVTTPQVINDVPVQSVVNPVQDMINQSSIEFQNQVMNQDMGLSAPVGDNSSIPEMPGAPDAPSVPMQDNVSSIQPQTVQENVQTQQSVTVEGPKDVKPNAYNVEAVIVTEEEQLINAYIGKNHKKIVHKRWNWAAFLFGGFYYFYRKMTIPGLLLLILNVVLTKFFPLGILILCILCGLVTNKTYVNFVKGKIDTMQKRNMDAGLSTLLLMCEKDGGTSGSMIIVALILSGAISFLFSKYAADIDYKELFNTLKNKGGEVIDKIEEEVDKFNEESILIPMGDRKYEGTMTFEQEPNITETFNFNFPEEFIMVEPFTNVLQYRYLDNGSGSTGCSIDIYQPQGYSTGESVIKQMKNYHAPSNKLKKISSNSIHWVSFDYEYSGHNYLYGTTFHTEPYIVEFHIYETEYKDVCLTYKDKIINGITIKEDM